MPINLLSISSSRGLTAGSRGIGRIIYCCLLSLTMTFTLVTPSALAKRKPPVTQLEGFYLSQQGEHTRFVFELSDYFHYRSFSLHAPERFVIDFGHARLSAHLSHPALINTPVKTLRHARRGDDLRVVLDLKRQTKRVRVFSLPKDKNHRYRLVVDMYDRPQSAKTMVQTALKKIMPLEIKLPKPRSRDIIVVIDPGHGGKDPGATGRHGTREKDVVLSIAKDLQRMLNEQEGFKAVLTRRGDYFISLRHRLDLARKFRADMFIAIHADAYLHRRAHGASVYALSERGATSEAARWLAQKENYSELAGAPLSDKGNTLRSVLIGLQQTATIGASLQIGGAILNKLNDFTQLHHDKVEQAAFVVLKSPDIPSLLVETGFLSNYSEEKRLRKYYYQHQLAWSIMQGIRSYFMSQPPRGTLFAENR